MAEASVAQINRLSDDLDRPGDGVRTREILKRMLDMITTVSVAGNVVTLSSIGGADLSEPYVTIGASTGLSAERALTGTANQIVITDGGANSTVTLSAPQNLHTSAVFRVGTLGIGAAASGGNVLDVTGTSILRDALVVVQSGVGDGLVVHYNSGVMAGKPFRLIDDSASIGEAFVDSTGGATFSSLNLKVSTWLLTFVQSVQTADRVITFPGVTGTVQLLSNPQTSTANMTWSGTQSFTNASVTVKSGLNVAYATGSFTVATGNSKILNRHLQLTTTQRASLAGTATLRMS